MGLDPIAIIFIVVSEQKKKSSVHNPVYVY